jgi:hypothetical protein
MPRDATRLEYMRVVRRSSNGGVGAGPRHIKGWIGQAFYGMTRERFRIEIVWVLSSSRL